MANYVPARVATVKLGVTLRTLLRWEEAGKIKTIKTPNGQRRYDLDSVISVRQSDKPTVLYARVHSSGGACVGGRGAVAAAVPASVRSCVSGG
ncbi:MAG: MerR family DNA-binding transcriptional regulator [Scytonema sp. PMC 1070.18]|nr:MerR family DNA-binding transcriptional regulator [Scytonema sp. PMC 1070.18]